MIPAPKFCVADRLPGAGAGGFENNPSQRPVIVLPDDLCRKINAARAAVENQIAVAGREKGNLSIAADALITLYEFYLVELTRITAEALQTFNQGGKKPASASCHALDVLDWILEFPIDGDGAIHIVDTLFLVFDNALAGKINLFERAAPPLPYSQPRRFCFRWFKENFFRALAWIRAIGAAPGGPGGVVVDVRPVPTASLPVTASTKNRATSVVQIVNTS